MIEEGPRLTAALFIYNNVTVSACQRSRTIFFFIENSPASSL